MNAMDIASPALWARKLSDGKFKIPRHIAYLDDVIVKAIIGQGPRRIVVSMPPRHGKQVDDETPVLTVTGWKKHGELSAGDFVFGLDGKPTEVVWVAEPTIQDMEVEFTDGSRVRVHENHEWTLFSRPRGKVVTVETKYLEKVKLWNGQRGKRGGRVNYQLPSHAPLSMPDSELPIDPYWLGVWLGDGRSSAPDFCWADNDSCVAERCSKIYPFSSQWRHKDTNVNYGYASGIRGKLRELGVLGDKHIPERYFLASTSQRLQLLAGLIDTDGCVDGKGRVRVVTASLRLAKGIKLLVRTLGWNCGIHSQEPHVSTSGVAGRQAIFGVDFTPSGSIPTEIPRKSVKGTGRAAIAIGVADVRRVEPSVGRCIQVAASDGLYLVGENLTPTHNSYYISEHLPAWYVGMFPDNQVILTSYEADFAASWGAKSRDLLMNSEDNLLGVKIDPMKKSANSWKIDGHRGGCVTAGAGGAITGKGAHLFIIDDPLKNSEEAQSETIRNKQWDWFRSTAYTRIEPGGVLVVVMCMTGDTDVLLPDGSSKKLCDVKPGDEIASYESGSIVKSEVVNWKSQGVDDCYEIKTKGGLSAKANKRHPFLVKRNGRLMWVRLREIVPGDKIQAVSGGGGGASNVNAEGQSTPAAEESVDARACARHATKKLTEKNETATETDGRELSTGTESLKSSMKPCLKSRAEFVQSANKSLNVMSEHTGAESFALTTATKQEECEACCATTVTSQLGMEKLQMQCDGLLNTLSVVDDEVVSVSPVGRLEVFDIQVKKTECFIANGLISHNTRWHMDDLAGRIIRELSDVEPWEVISFPAIAEETDVLGRKEGEALWPERRPINELENIRSTVGPFWWSALYQQRPTPIEGGLFKLEFFSDFYETTPQVVKACRFWDLAATKNSDSDYTVGLLLALCDDNNFYVMDIVRGRWAPYERDRIIKQVAQLDGYNVKIRMEKEPGASGESLCDSMGRMLTGYNFRGIRSKDSKMARVNSIDGIASVAGVGRLRLKKGYWTRDFIDELIMFPNALHDDQVDALSGAYKALTQEKTVYVA